MYFSRIVVAELIEALDQGKVIPSIIERNPHFDWDAAYRVAAEIVKLRRARGEKTVGRKIGFTNRNIWAEYGATAPIWAHVYDRTVQFAARPPRHRLAQGQRAAAPRARDRVQAQGPAAGGRQRSRAGCSRRSNGWRRASRSWTATLPTGNSGLPIRPPIFPSTGGSSSARPARSVATRYRCSWTQLARLPRRAQQERRSRGPGRRRERAGPPAAALAHLADIADAPTAVRAARRGRDHHHRHADRRDAGQAG